MYPEVKNIIFGISPISEPSFQKMIPLLHRETVRKGETFIHRNKRNGKEYFLINGVCKSYLFNPEGDEITISFFQENSILSPHAIRTSQGISNLNFKALTNAEMVSIDAGEFENLMIEDPEIRNFANRVLQNELISKVEKETGLASLTAMERLTEFRRKFKNLENLVPHPDIASYLGITNISLSRLRKEMK